MAFDITLNPPASGFDISFSTEAALGQISVGEVWKDVSGLYIVVGGEWKVVTGVSVVDGQVWRVVV